mmetsp:Transcript_26388/g.73787  ORF Transcript_26388/g.73787 Transcript_26388/m.73787 type:complete len:86 (+) Transcript_26388:1765-2022(+)
MLCCAAPRVAMMTQRIVAAIVPFCDGHHEPRGIRAAWASSFGSHAMAAKQTSHPLNIKQNELDNTGGGLYQYQQPTEVVSWWTVA